MHDAGFRNYYEETKYLAELEVEGLKRDLPITIHRPSVVCGDSQSGETAKYDGIYYLIHYLLKWPSVLSTINIGNRDVALNLVPVDFVVEAMATLASDPLSIGKTVQLADPNPLTTRELFNAIAACVAGREAQTDDSRALSSHFANGAASPTSDRPATFSRALFFSETNLRHGAGRALLKPHGVSCPPFKSYVETIVDYAARHPTAAFALKTPCRLLSA